MKVLLEGRPGAGKTTVLARLARRAPERGIAVSGFVTLELREAELKQPRQLAQRLLESSASRGRSR